MTTLDYGIHTMTADAYHADPSERPSLNGSIAKVLIERTPLHAWYAHPKLNPDFKRRDEQKFDVGTAAHALLFEGVKPFVVDAGDWRTKAAQEARKAARDQGDIPLLTHEAEKVKAMVDAVREQLAALDIDPRPFTDGKAEQTLIWEEPGGVTCRARLDWLRDDHAAIDDMKTCARTANPYDWARSTLWSIGADIQVAFNLRGLEKVTGTQEAEFRFTLVETSPPYAISTVALEPAALELGKAKVERAIQQWRFCLKENHWPGYSSSVWYAEPPPWVESDFMQRDAEAMHT